jgi:hypothetical protein
MEVSAWVLSPSGEDWDGPLPAFGRRRGSTPDRRNSVGAVDLWRDDRMALDGGVADAVTHGL